MSISVVLFKIIDVLCHPGQNYKKFDGITVKKDIAYGSDAMNKGDIFYDEKQKGENGYPVILHMHGGGFTAGDKKHRYSLSSYYASKGWFVYNINYRLSPKQVFPEPIADAILALNYLKTLAETYPINLDKIVVTGDSAGAYLSSYLVACATNEALVEKLNLPKIDVKIAGQMSFCGPYNLIKCMEKPLPFGLTRDIAQCFLGYELDKKMSNYKGYQFVEECSPSNYVNEKWPPSFLSMSGKDVFCAGQGEALADQLKDLNVPVYTYASTKFADNHCFHLEFFKKESKKCMAEAFKYMDIIKNA